MGINIDIHTDIFSVFKTDDWKSRNIITIPENVVLPDDDHIVINVHHQPSEGNCITGQLFIEIKTVSGVGPRPARLIADTLDSYLEQKSFSHTQFFRSSFSGKGVYASEPAKYLSVYTIPFKHYR